MILDISYFNKKLKGSLPRYFSLIKQEINQSIIDCNCCLDDYQISIYPYIEISRIDKNPISDKLNFEIRNRLKLK